MTQDRDSVADGRIHAVFLDRDGTIIEDCGHLDHPSQVVPFPETMHALRRLHERFLLFIVTNQSGIGEGILSVTLRPDLKQWLVPRPGAQVVCSTVTSTSTHGGT